MNQLITRDCDPRIYQQYGWCEQWECTNNCTCADVKHCKQYCGERYCKQMNCHTSGTCLQTPYVNYYKKATVQIEKMYANSPFVHQVCTGGLCDRLWADQTKKESKITRYFSVQNCVDGKCKKMRSNTEISKQFCGNCEAMYCFGEFATNCTQKCLGGHCNIMFCQAEYCKQTCSHGSNCSMRCAAGVKQCKQICKIGSKCSLSCDAENCLQDCNGLKHCQIIKGSANKKHKLEQSLNLLKKHFLSQASRRTHGNFLIGKLKSIEHSMVLKSPIMNESMKNIQSGLRSVQVQGSKSLKPLNRSDHSLVFSSSTRCKEIDITLRLFVVMIFVLFIYDIS